MLMVASSALKVGAEGLAGAGRVAWDMYARVVLITEATLC